MITVKLMKTIYVHPFQKPVLQNPHENKAYLALLEFLESVDQIDTLHCWVVPSANMVLTYQDTMQH